MMNKKAAPHEHERSTDVVLPKQNGLKWLYGKASKDWAKTGSVLAIVVASFTATFHEVHAEISPARGTAAAEFSEGQLEQLKELDWSVMGTAMKPVVEKEDHLEGRIDKMYEILLETRASTNEDAYGTEIEPHFSAAHP